ncbi:MAG: hypothetical protein RBG13Loki_1426 [Promethearchaeota archaeon CR_4]|nr:MAG: hypothetical protein RBG13Loki_1426 [Candidatus Lokiarchaeota archaeon CR_4]
MLKRIASSILNSLGAGLVPRGGLEHIIVGRLQEISALMQDLKNVGAGGATFRFISGFYGSGKTFLLQYVRNQALSQDFIVADADLSPARRLIGSHKEGLATYRELVKNLATKIRPGGEALKAILEKWISKIQQQVLEGKQISPQHPDFKDAVSFKIRKVVSELQELVHGFDFGNVIVAYWEGYMSDNEEKKRAAMQWLRGEFPSKTVARRVLNVNTIIDDESWYDYLKVLARFAIELGYKGVLVFLDEAIHLYNIANSVARNRNYEVLLAMLNDALQGRVEHLGLFVSCVPDVLEDTTRGLFSIQAFRSRLSDNFIASPNLRDLSAPVLKIASLKPEEILTLLQRLTQVHSIIYAASPKLSAEEIKHIAGEITRRGPNQDLTPRDYVRNFLTLLNLKTQNPSKTTSEILGEMTIDVTIPEIPQISNVDESNI